MIGSVVVRVKVSPDYITLRLQDSSPLYYSDFGRKGGILGGQRNQNGDGTVGAANRTEQSAP